MIWNIPSHLSLWSKRFFFILVQKYYTWFGHYLLSTPILPLIVPISKAYNYWEVHNFRRESDEIKGFPLHHMRMVVVWLWICVALSHIKMVGHCSEHIYINDIASSFSLHLFLATNIYSREEHNNKSRFWTYSKPRVWAARGLCFSLGTM